MSEASSLLLDDDGNLKPLNKFTEDIKKLNDTYNDNYLRAERNFASRSAQSAAKWQKYETGKDRYDLRYLTDNGPNVRDSHRALEFTTLPVDDPFWNQYTPPNGYNCHCFLVQVRKGEYPVSDSTDAIAKGDQATTQIGKDGSNKAAIFRFNPGKEMKVMPPNHPYTSGNCGNLSAVWHTLSVSQKIQLAGQADKCRAKKVVEEMSGNINKEETKTLQKQIKKTEIGIIETTHIGSVVLNSNSVNKTYNVNAAEYKKDALKQLYKAGKNLKKVKELPDLERPATKKKALKKPNIEGYYRIIVTDEKKRYEYLLEKDKAEKRGLKLYYIKRKK